MRLLDESKNANKNNLNFFCVAADTFYMFSKTRTFLIKKSGILKKSGSAAIILSLVVSASVLSTIFISQRSANWFLSSQAKNIEDWEHAFVSQTAMAIGGYLISNNLVLCKEGGWENYDAKCKWNNESSMNLSEFNLRSKTVWQPEGGGDKVLSFKGTVDEDVIDNPQSDAGDIDYRITFDLVNWKETSVQNLIGEIPQSVCRDGTTMSIREGDCPLPVVDKCKDNGVDIPNSICEYISDNDEDYTIVLISVQVPFDKPASTVYAGVRRPLSIPKVAIIPPGPVCRLTCAGSIAASLPECRGEFLPPTGEDNFSVVNVQVTNEGPGAIYALSLLRKDTYKSDDSIRYSGTGRNLLELEHVKKEVFLPGEHFTFEDYIDCEDSVSYTFSFERIRVGRNPVWQGGAVNLGTSVYKRVNVHAQPFMEIHYGLFSLSNPVGACMVLDEDNPMMKPVEVEETTACPNTRSLDQTCGDGGAGECYYSHIEPRRNYVSGSKSYEIKKEHTDIKSGSVVRFLSPH